MCSWLILVQVPLHLKIFDSFFIFLPMAASGSNKMETPDPDWNRLQPDLPINQVDWDHVKTYLFDRFTTPPTEFLNRQGHTIIPDVHPTSICEHIMHFRPCPSFMDPSYQCPGYHPEFLLQGTNVIWTPRTWSCRAFQRRTDLAAQDHCHRPGCQQLHRPGWAHSELVAFRSWVLSVNRAYWFTIYCCQPNINGKSPLYVTHYQDIHYCLTNQAYLPYSSFIKHDWKETVEPPLTYIQDTASHVQPYAANYYDDERVQQRRALHQRQRSQTPRRPRPEQVHPASDFQTPAPFLPSHSQPATTPSTASPRFGPGTPPRSRQPTGSSGARPTTQFPAPASTPTSFSLGHNRPCSSHHRLPPTHRGDHHLGQSTTNTCHNLTGIATSDGPRRYKNLQPTEPTWTPACAGQSTNPTNCRIYMPFAWASLQLNTLVEELHDQTQHWYQQIPTHCQHAYKQSHAVTQIPTLIHILQQLHYPHTKQLQSELSQGFQLIGALHPGLNWHVRTDQKYTTPTSLEELRQHNQQYIHQKLQQHRVDPHWRLMAEEIANEVRQGRMAGPFHGPSWLHHTTKPLLDFEHTSTLLPLPHTDPIVAMAFSIEQTVSDGKAKIRRGEDWRRSGHNQACQMADQPYHHTPDHYTWLAQYTCQSSQETPLVWGHDHDGAYRQLPLDDPSIYVLLLTPSGPTLWHHHVLLFGSAASVWAFNRFGDMLSAIARTITCIPVVHYVDDYGSIEPTQTANSGFSTFEQLNSILGFHMKKSKRQPPEQSHRIQGVVISCDTMNITVAPCKDRVDNISQQLRQHLHTKSMTPEQARKLAGKCSFTTTHLFGRVGRAALRALYDKAFSNTDSIGSQTQSAIIALLDILNNCQPRSLLLRPSTTQHTIIYTDAFHRDGDKQLRCSELIQQDEPISPSPSMTNGWAAVIFHPASSRPLVFNGTVPPKLLKHFASNKAFIYFLEAWAAIITPILVKPLLTPTYIQLCDNDAATHAIIKGSGSHAPLNNLLGSHWTWHNRHCLRQILRRVPTHANIADPFSREDFTIAQQLQWPILEPPTNRLLETTKKIIGDSRFAHQIGFTQDPYVLQFQSLAYQKLFPTSYTQRT